MSLFAVVLVLLTVTAFFRVAEAYVHDETMESVAFWGTQISGVATLLGDLILMVQSFRADPKGFMRALDMFLDILVIVAQVLGESD